MDETHAEIDRYDLDSNTLTVRGTEVTALAADDHAKALVFALTGHRPRESDLRLALDRVNLAAAASVGRLLPEDVGLSRPMDAASAIEAVAEGLFALRRSRAGARPDNPLGDVFDADTWQAYVLFHETALLAGCLSQGDRRPFETWREEGGFRSERYADALARLFVDPTGSADLAARAGAPSGRLLTCLVGGFGIAAPTTTLARFSASTRAPLEWALAASAMGCGPAHLGACSLAMDRLSAAVSGPGDPVERYCARHPFPGFGHPIMPFDPRTAYLFSAYEGDLPARAAAIAATVTARRGLHPNIDLAAASVFLSWGLRPAAGSCLFWVSRLPIVLAHACDKRRQPAFGLRSADAREKYREMPKHWI